ncbi:MAG TPA: arsenite efflux MFS transporter ArsK [Devosiaceae bacterium]|nr:arsenite efflux MFS transporter ArsK [Devosiaceae bacterium]
MLRVISTGKSLSPASSVWLLGVSQLIGYGTLYYSFSILAGDIGRSFAWPVSWLYGCFSLALLAGGVIAPLIGRRIDRHGAATVMALGSALSAAALCWASCATNPIVFAAALIAMQAASALVLYDAAFAALVQLTGAEARLRITHLTLIAGFASTLFWPLTSWLHAALDWRQILLVFAGLNLFVSLPIHALLAARPRRSIEIVPSPSGDTGTPTAIALPPNLQRRMLMLMTLGFALSNFALSALLAQLVPTLTTVGLGASALLVASLFGPAQVLVRFVNMLLGVRRHPLPAALIGLAMTPLAIAVLMLSAPAVPGAVVFAALLGFGSGLKSIVQGTLPLALFGAGSYGARLGIMAAARQVLSALAPFAFAALSGAAGTSWALAALAVAGVLGLAALLEVGRLGRADFGSNAAVRGEGLAPLTDVV